MNPDEVNTKFDPNEYSRPNSKWNCGRISEGLGCPIGPGNDGRCRAVCTPYLKLNRYHCNHASLHDGKCDAGPGEDGACSVTPAICRPAKKGKKHVCTRGACLDGPNPDGTCGKQFPPCNPTRRVLSRREIVSCGAFVLAVGLAMMMVARPASKSIISPGNLTSHHSSVADKCSSCHALDDEGTLNDWVHVGLFGKRIEHSQTDLCMTCHHDLGVHPESAHTINSDLLAQITNSVSNQPDDASWQLKLSRMAFQPHQKTECSVCHKEHHGAEFDLKQLTDNQCQVCHASAFHSFVDGHPKFTEYPYQRRTRIYFDHVSHYGVHFRESSRYLNARDDVSQFLTDGGPSQSSCAVCHLPDAAGQQMLVRPFEDSCAACHADQVENNIVEGISVFALPAVDPQHIPTLWNNTNLDRRGDHLQTAGTLPPIMRLLLSADDKFRELDQLLQDIDLSRLQNEIPQVRDSAKQYVEIVTRELDLIVRQGPAGIESRLEQTIGAEVSRDQINQLVQLIDHDWIVLATTQFVRSVLDDTAANGKMDNVDHGWYVRSRDRSLRYRPMGHADPLIKNLLDVSAKLGGADSTLLPIRDLYLTVSHAAGTGRCLKCHTVDKQPDGEISINWEPFGSQPVQREFTHFSHQPHLVMFSENACMNCHDLKTRSAAGSRWQLFRPEFIDQHLQALTNGSQFEANFELMGKANCTACHKPNRVSQSCTTCHNYHVNSVGR